MDELSRWLSDNKQLCQPQKKHALRAVRHLSHIERKNLFSEELSFMKSAEGRWFEMITYELFLDLVSKTDVLRAVILKGADVRGKKILPALGQNGFYYSRNGDITLRGNGQDLAEFDLLLVKHDGSLVFVEVVTSPSDLKDFLMEIYYKKEIIRFLFNQKAVTFILVTSFPLANYKGGRKVLASKEHISLCTKSCETFRKHLPGIWSKTRIKPELPVGKTVRSTDLPVVREFNYKEYHDLERDWVFSNLTDGEKMPDLPSPYSTQTLVKKVIFGRLFPSTVKKLCERYQFAIKSEILTSVTLTDRFSKIILAADLPDYEPIIYLRQRNKKEYLKMVYNGAGVFKFERKTPPKVGFFVWLESLEPELGANIAIRTIDTLSRYCFAKGENKNPVDLSSD